jgi:hypothetical protein
VLTEEELKRQDKEVVGRIGGAIACAPVPNSPDKCGSRFTRSSNANEQACLLVNTSAHQRGPVLPEPSRRACSQQAKMNCFEYVDFALSMRSC